MRKITKGSPPESLKDWIRSNPQATYGELPENILRDIRTSCASEQYFLCGYCGSEVSGENIDTSNEHLLSQHHHPRLQLDYGNIIASCIRPRQCNNSHGSTELPLTPLMDECESEITYRINGTVSGTTPRAIQTIEVLNLGSSRQNNKSLVEKRKVAIQSALFSHGVNADDLMDDCELRKLLIEEIMKISDGKMIPFAPAIRSAIISMYGD